MKNIVYYEAPNGTKFKIDWRLPLKENLKNSLAKAVKQFMLVNDFESVKLEIISDYIDRKLGGDK